MSKEALSAAGRSHVGRVRDHNEDTAGITEIAAREQSFLLWLVADGMGGLVKGEVAAAIARDEMTAALQEVRDWHDPGGALRDAVRRTNAAVYRTGTADGELTRSAMGTTLVAALLEPATGRYWISNVGDSRAYLIRGEAIQRLTQDHSFVAEQVASGALTAEEARTASRRNVVTRAVGTDPEVEPDIFGPLQLGRGEVLLLCSDGLHGMVEDPMIASTVAGREFEEAAEALIRAANHAGGRDNITAIVGGWRLAEAEDEPGGDGTPIEAAPEMVPLRGRHRWPWAVLAGAGLLAAAIGAAMLLVSGGDGERTYVVQDGEDCAAVAAKNGVSEPRLRDLNSAMLGSGQPCSAGMKLVIPAASEGGGDAP